MKVDLLQPQDSSLKVEHNVSLAEKTDSSTVAAEFLIGGATLRLFKNTYFVAKSKSETAL